MPLITSKDFNSPYWSFNGHLQTIIPAVFRQPMEMPFIRDRIVTPDGDFLDLDWLRQGSNKLVILSHGLEGNSCRPYMKGMAKAFFSNQFDVLAWNYRGCSGEINHTPVFYHSGATYDLDTVIRHSCGSYEEVILVGFSLGGNLVLKYLGESPVHPKIKKAITLSVPLDLKSASHKLSSRENFLYTLRFLRTLKHKIIQKSLRFPGKIDTGFLSHIKTLYDFDNYYTGPIHGFQDAHEYYQKSSSINFLKSIKTPTLILNSQNDPFLSTQCFPRELGEQLENVYLDFPKLGGHVGFCSRDSKGIYWSEKRAIEFMHSEE
jgi:predicted alpha/beta-fold hydrolase